MKFLNRLERKFGKYAIPNLMMGLIFCYAAGYVIQLTAPGLLAYLTLDPYMIFQGQIWRLITWIVVPDSAFNVLLTLIMLMFYYSIGTSLERTWGEFRFNLYIIGGILISDLAAILLYLALGMPQISFLQSFSTTYINLSLFLAYAVCYPDNSVLLMFLIPVKMKYMGIVYGVFALYEIFVSNIATRTAIVASLLNFVIFYLLTRNYSSMSPVQRKRRKEFHKQIRPTGYTSADGRVTKHKCAVCGRTEADGENLEFRFCSKCDGNFEYCQDHLFTHTHVKKN